MKIGKSSACIAFLILGSLAFLSGAKAQEAYYTFEYALSAPTDTNTITFDLPTAVDPLEVDSTVGITITNSKASGVFGISPAAPNPYIEDVYLGTSADPEETLVGALGTAFSGFGTGKGKNNSVTKGFEDDNTLPLGGGYTEITVVTDFTPLDLSGAAFTGSIDLEYMMVPEPSTWALFLGGLGAIGLLKLRQRKQNA